MAGKVKFHFNNTSVELTDDQQFPLSLTRSVADLRDPGKGSGSHSKTYKIPATKANNEAFEHLYDSNVKQDESDVQAVKAKVDSTILVDEMPVFTGYSRIQATHKDLQPQSYEVVTFSDNSDWIKLLKGKYLDELDFGTATWSKSAIQAVQALTYGSTDFQYPLINYGDFEYSDGCGTEDFRPAPYLASLLTKIFNDAGYNLTAKWLTESDCQEIILAHTGGNWRHTEATNEERRAQVTTTVNQALAANVNNTITFGTTDYDPLTQIGSGTVNNIPTNPTTGTNYTPTYTGRYKFTGSLTIDNTANGSQTQVQVFIGDDTLGITRLSETVIIPASSTHTVTLDSDTFDLTAGNEHFVLLNPTQACTLDSGSSISFAHTSDIVVGAVYDVGETLPHIDQLQFVSDVKRLFNLYIDADVQTKTVVMEPRNTWRNSANSEVNGYYKTEATAVDWSKKLDYSRNIEHEIISNLKKTLEFAYKADSKDGKLKAENEGKNVPFGAYQNDLEDRFPEGVDKRHTKLFAATWHQYNTNLNAAGTRVLVPALLKEDEDTPQEKSFEFAPRLLRYKYTNEANKYGETVTLKYYEDSGAAPASEETNIPKAYFVNYDSLSDFQLSFDSITGGKGLFERFWYSTMPEINDGRILKAHFFLKPSDFVADMRELVYVDGVYYTINKINGYKPLRDEVTKVELIPRNVWNESAVTASSDPSARLANPGGARQIDRAFLIEDDNGNIVPLYSEDALGNYGLMLIDTDQPNANELIPFSNRG